jgi:carbonic anhydrase
MAKSEETAEGELRVVAKPASAEKTKGTAAKGAGARQAALSAGKATGAADALVLGDWAYEGPAGPERWSQLKPEYAACGQGKRQSPIDVRGGIKVQLEPIQFNYRRPEFSVIDNGRTVRVHVAPGNFIEVMGRRYELTHAQFHKPSEVLIEGKAFEMSIHLIHRDALGRMALIAVPLERGNAHPAIQSVWNNLPLEKGVDLPARVPLDLMSLLPEDQRYATFMGSMTTPPCQEGVLWMVMKTPVSVSPHQLAVFSHLYPMNARPVQPSHGRLIKESE